MNTEAEARGGEMAQDMEGRVVLITGGSSGIGQEYALRFLDRGARVVVCARRIERLRETFHGRREVLALQVDVSEAEQVQTLVQRAEAEFGRIDVLLNNAAVLFHGQVEEMTPSEWRRAYDVNVLGVFLCCRYVLPGMRERDYGRIINMSSGGSVNCAPGYSLYSSSKAAVNAFTKSLGRELEGTNVKVNVMSPGPCRTEMFPDNPLHAGAGFFTALKLATLPADGPNGRFFWMEREVQVIPDLSHVNWTDPSTLDRGASHETTSEVPR